MQNSKVKINSNTKKSFVFARLRRRVLSHVKIVRAAILGLIFVLVLLFGLFIFNLAAKSFVGTSIGMVRNFIFPAKTRILTNKGRINILIMGIGGPGHDGSDLTDTLILASVSTTSHKISLISIPRDIWIPSLKDKINSAYFYGKQKSIETGIVLAKSTVSEVLGTQVDYGVVIDFTAFKDVIDAMGGIQVDVKNGFTDNQYPITGRENDNCNGDITFACRYETLTFKSGLQNMDGETALKFVRSRHASGIEGNDISREARQQLVIAAIVKKYLMPKVFTDLKLDFALFNIGMNNIKTDLKPSEEATIARYVIDAKNSMKSYTIPDTLLYTPPNEYKYSNNLYTHAFVFIPANKTGSWIDVQNWVQTILP